MPHTHQSHGSQQLRIFRRTYRDTADLAAACAASGIEEGEARIHLARDASQPPPPEAFLTLAEEQDMARRARQDAQEQPQEVGQKDFAKAAKLYQNDIKPARTQASKFMQDVSTAFKAVNKVCRIQPGAMRQAISIMEREDADRDDYLRSLVGAVNELAGETLLTFHSADLVDQAEGAAPNRSARKPDLVLVNPPATDDDLAAAGGAEPTDTGKLVGDFDEASEEELSRQEGRGGNTESED